MLLIAQPKSASTSLMWSIAEILKIKHKNGHNKTVDDRNPDCFKELLKYHGTMVVRKKQFLQPYIVSRTVLYKEHILPIESHIKMINEINVPVVVLIRDEKESVNSYKRVYSVLPEINPDYVKLEAELKSFADIYKRIAEQNKLYMIVTYKDIVNDFTNTIKSVILHYGFNVPENIEKYQLAKRNYSWSKYA